MCDCIIMHKLTISDRKNPAVNIAKLIIRRIFGKTVMYPAVDDAPVQRTGYNRHILCPVRHTCNIDIPVKNGLPSRFPCLLSVRFGIVPDMNIL